MRLVEERLGIELPDHHEATLGGVILEKLGRLPQPGEVVSLDGSRFEVVKAEHAQIQELRLLPQEHAD